MKTPNKILDYIQLIRLDKPIGIFLLYFPCIFGLSLGFNNLKEFRYYAILFLIGSILMRSAGCIINDLFDKDLDAKVERTKTRPIASGAISSKEALIVLSILLLLSLIILNQLSRLSIIIALLSMINVIVYPLMKRWTYWPQAFLGLTFNIGVLVGYSAIADNLNVAAIIFYIGCIFWTLGYDTIYAFMDTKDDIKIGIKSTALAIKDLNYRLILLSFYTVFILCIITSCWSYNITNIPCLGFMAIAVMLLAWQVITLDIDRPQNCLNRFKSNQYVGILIVFYIFFLRF